MKKFLVIVCLMLSGALKGSPINPRHRSRTILPTLGNDTSPHITTDWANILGCCAGAVITGVGAYYHTLCPNDPQDSCRQDVGSAIINGCFIMAACGYHLPPVQRLINKLKGE